MTFSGLPFKDMSIANSLGREREYPGSKGYESFRLSKPTQKKRLIILTLWLYLASRVYYQCHVTVPD